jgi:hypothetical protein
VIDDTSILKKRRLSKVFIIGSFSFLLFVILTTGYLWRRSVRPKLILPTDSKSKERLLEENLLSTGLPFETPFLIENQTIAASVSGLTVFFSSSKDLSIQVRSLQLLLPEVTMSKDKISVIDLRFSKAVMK